MKEKHVRFNDMDQSRGVVLCRTRISCLAHDGEAGSNAKHT